MAGIQVERAAQRNDSITSAVIVSISEIPFFTFRQIKVPILYVMRSFEFGAGLSLLSSCFSFTGTPKSEIATGKRGRESRKRVAVSERASTEQGGREEAEEWTDGRGRTDADGRTASKLDPSVSRPTCAEGFWTLQTLRVDNRGEFVSHSENIRSRLPLLYFGNKKYCWSFVQGWRRAFYPFFAPYHSITPRFTEIG